MQTSAVSLLWLKVGVFLSNPREFFAEVLYALSGTVKIDLSDGTRETTVELSQSNCGVVIPQMVWCRLYDFSADFVGLCFASEPYDLEGYLSCWEDFLKELDITKHKV